MPASLRLLQRSHFAVWAVMASNWVWIAGGLVGVGGCGWCCVVVVLLLSLLLSAPSSWDSLEDANGVVPEVSYSDCAEESDGRDSFRI